MKKILSVLMLAVVVLACNKTEVVEKPEVFDVLAEVSDLSASAGTVEVKISTDYTDFEVICVNDGSTDGSEHIIRGFEARDSRFRYYVKNHTNAGEARNIGLKYARGEYLYFMDSDDLLVPTILEELIVITKEQNPDTCHNTGEP